MPEYDYQCMKCGNIQEENHGMFDVPIVQCRKCGKSGMNRTVSRVNGFVRGSENPCSGGRGSTGKTDKDGLKGL